MSTQVTIFNGVNVEQETYMAAFAAENGLVSITSQIIEQAQKEAEKIDATTAAGRKALASLAYSVAKAKTAIDNEGKDLVSDAKAKIKIVDNNRAYVRNTLSDLQDEIRAPVTAYEQAEKEKQEQIEAALSSLSRLTITADAFGNPLSSADLIQAKAEAEGVQNQHEEEAINLKKTEVITFLSNAIEAAKIREEQQAEIARLKQEKEARERAEAEAQAKARAEKERAERDARIAEEAAEAERKKVLAEQKAAHDAEVRRLEEEKRKAEAEAYRMLAEQKAAEEAEKKRLEEEAKRAADVEHKRTINRAILEQMAACGIEQKAAEQFLSLVIKGKVANIKVTY